MTESTTRQVQQVIDHLRHDLPTIPEPELEGAVIHEFREFHDARVREYLPVLVERRLRGQFRLHRAGSRPAVLGPLRVPSPSPR